MSQSFLKSILESEDKGVHDGLRNHLIGSYVKNTIVGESVSDDEDDSKTINEQQLDDGTIRELDNHIENFQELMKIKEDIMRKSEIMFNKGAYNGSLAMRSWGRLVNYAAKHYANEYGSNGSNGLDMFGKAERKELVRRLEQENRECLDNPEDQGCRYGG